MEAANSTRCRYADSCKGFQRLKNYGTAEADYEHCTQYSHPTVPCRYSSNCTAFLRLADGGFRMSDLCHAVCYTHPRQLHFSSTLPRLMKVDQYAAHGKYLPDERGCLCGQAHYEEYKIIPVLEQVQMLEQEVIDNGFESVLFPSDGEWRRLRDVAAAKVGHPRNVNGSLNQAEILALLLYTGSDVQGVFRSDMINKVPRWPHMYRLLRIALTKGESSSGAQYAYHGLHNVTVSNYSEWVHESRHGKWEVAFLLPAVTSVSLNKQVAIDFAAGEGGTSVKKNTIGCLLQLHYVGYESSNGGLSNGYGCFPGIDVSWISKFPSEEEVTLLPFAVCAPEFLKSIEFGLPKRYSSREAAIAALRANITEVEATTSHGNRVRLQQITLYVSTQYSG